MKLLSNFEATVGRICVNLKYISEGVKDSVFPEEWIRSFDVAIASGDKGITWLAGFLLFLYFSTPEIAWLHVCKSNISRGILSCRLYLFLHFFFLRILHATPK